MTARIAINGYGTIGKRVADAVAAQDDMRVAGVAKTKPDFEAKLLAKLGRGGACPHGNLSEMESPKSRQRRGLVLLSQAEPGNHYCVSSVYERDRHLLEFLNARGIRPGVKLDVVERNYDKTLSIRTSTGTVVLGRPAAERIWVSTAPSSAL